MDTGFRKRSCSNSKLERDGDSTESHPALGAILRIRLPYCRLIAGSQSSGHLILTSSVAGRRALPGSLYSATKHAVTAMAEALRQEADGAIRVTCIEPGMVDTPFFSNRPDNALEADDIPVEDAPGRRFGDVGYVVFEMPDGERAARFYRDLFGWELHGGYQPGAYHIASITPPSGIDTGYEKADTRIYFRVDDIEATAARVRELGGQVLETGGSEAGGNAKCVDPQGLRFDLFRPKPGY